MRARDPTRGRTLLLAALAAVVVAIPSVGTLASPGAAADTPGQSAPCPTTNPPNELILEGGSPQTAQLDTAFDSPLQVALANTNGCPVTSVVGTPVSFAAPASGAGGRFATSGSNTVTVGADVSGNASAPMFTANESAGSYTVTASSAFGSVSFSLTNSAAGIPTTITPLSPAVQSAKVNSDYPQPLSVRVLDTGGNPVSGATVTFSFGAAGGGGSAGASSAGGSFAGGSAQATVTTDTDGIATSPRFTANATIGRFTATATVANVPEPASFRLENLPGKGERLTALASPGRTATVGHRYSHVLRVRLTDAAGRPVLGATVTFTLGGAGGGAGASAGGGAGASFADGTSTATAITGIRGIATSPSFTADSVTGTFTAIATVANVGQPASFRLENLPGKGERLATLDSPSRTATVGHRYGHVLRVRLIDAAGAPVPGATVTFTLGGAGTSTGAGAGASASASAGTSFAGGASTATATTDIHGIAISPSFTAGTAAGTFTATASTTTTSSTARFTLSNRPGAPATITPGIAATEATPTGTRFPIALAVTVTDAFGNKVPGALVTFAAPTGGASGSFANPGGAHAVSVRSDSHGVAVAPPFFANAQPGGYIVIATVGRGSRTAFALVNETP